MQQIEVNGPNGALHLFPAGTSDEEIDRQLRELYGRQEQQAQDQAVQKVNEAHTNAQPSSKKGGLFGFGRLDADKTNVPRRSAGERFGDNMEDAWETSWMVEGFRAGYKRAADNNDRAEGERSDAKEGYFGINPANYIGDGWGFLRKSFGVDIRHKSDTDLHFEKQRRDEFESVNANGDSFLRYWREGDIPGFALHSVAALTGALTGSAPDPTNFVGGPGKGLVARALFQGVVAGGTDIVAQKDSMASGLEEDFSLERLATTAALGVGFQATMDIGAAGFKRSGPAAAKAKQGIEAVHDRLFRQNEADIAPHLDAFDEVHRAPDTRDPISSGYRVVVHNGKEIGLRGAGVPVDQVAGGVREGDYVENGMVWREAVPVLETRAEPETPKTDEAPSEGGGGSAVQSEGEQPATGEARPEGAHAPAEQPQGWGPFKFEDMQQSVRTHAAIKHEKLIKAAIKPDQVASFMDTFNNFRGGPNVRPHINRDWIDWTQFRGKPDEIVRLGEALGEVFNDAYESAGVTKQQTHADLKAHAHEMGYSMSEVMSLGDDVKGLTARSYVLRDLFNGASDHLYARLTELSAQRKTGTLTPVQVQELTEMIEMTTVLGSTDRRVAQEIGRALKARQIMSKPKFGANELDDMLGYLSNTLNDKGEKLDVKKVFDIVDDLKTVYVEGGGGKVHQRLRIMRKWGAWDYIGYAVVANLLSGLPTHFRNMVGGPMQATLDLASRTVAAGLVRPARFLALKAANKDLKNIETTKMREVLAYAQGNLNASGEALFLAYEGFKKGANVTDGKSTVLTDTSFTPFAMSKDRLKKWQEDGYGPRSMADMAGVVYFETARTLGFRPSVAADEFNKAMARRGELHALAYRRAAEASARAGGDKALFDAVHKSILERPSDAALIEAKEALEAEAFSIDGTYDLGSVEFKYQQMIKNMDVTALMEAQAELVTFQESGPMVEAIQSLLRRAPLFKHFSANFVRTPVQILKAVTRDYNPLTAPFVIALEATSPRGRKRHKAFLKALANEESDFRGGGAAAERVIARQVVGAAVMGVMWGIWASGNVVGEDVPEGEQYAGVKPYSVKVPGIGWVQFTGYSPFGDLLGMVADVGRIMEVRETTSMMDFSLIGAMAVAIRSNVVNKSFFVGMFEMMELIGGGRYIDQGDSVAHEEQIGKALIKIAAGRLIPGSAMLRRIAQNHDPVVRDVRTLAETVTSHLPGRSETLAAKRDFMGRKVIRTAGERGIAQLAQVSEVKTEPLDVLLHVLANTPGIDMKISPVSRRIDGHELTTHEYSRLLEIQGQVAMKNGMNMEQTLKAAASDPKFLALSQREQAREIKEIVSGFRRAGKAMAFDPNSPVFISSFVERTGQVRLESYALDNGLSLQEAFRKRGRKIGLQDMSLWDEAMEEME